MDFNGCGDGPCMAGTNCTDLTPEEEAAQGAAFTCSQCPQGYEDNDGVCVGTSHLIVMLNLFNLINFFIEGVSSAVVTLQILFDIKVKRLTGLSIIAD